MISRLKQILGYPPFLIVQKLLGKIPGQPVKIARLFIMELPVFPVEKILNELIIREAGAEDISSMCLLENKRDLFQKRFSAGERCILAVKGEQIIGYEWISTKNIHIEERYNYPLKVPDDAVYAYDALIKPEYRRQGIWSSLQKYTIYTASRDGRKKVMVMVDHDNQISIQAHLRFGYVFSRQVFVLMLLGREFFREKRMDHKQFNFS